MDERELVHQLKARNQDAVKVFLAQYKREVFLALRHVCRNEQDVEDAFSEVVLRVWEKIHLYDEAPDRSLGSWVRVLAVNCARNMLRRQSQARGGAPPPVSLEEIVELPAPTTREVEPEAVEREPTLFAKLLLDALSRLVPRYRKLLKLVADGRTTGEIAEITGDASSVVSVKLHQAANALLRELGKDARIQAAGLVLPPGREMLRTLREINNLRTADREGTGPGNSPSQSERDL